jgi:zinc-binding alcohol dehydrogenase/oxidoreductase
MQAVVVHQWGGPEVLSVEQVAYPAPKPGYVLVELKAGAVNRHDMIIRRSGLGFPLPRILGIDGAGVRRDTGEKVVLYPAHNWGTRESANGPDFEVLGDSTDGTYAELISVPTANVYPKPARLSWVEAAALPVAGLTAYRALFTRARVQAGEKVLIMGAGGGVSTFAVSMAAAAGARVFVTSADAAKIDAAKELGATEGVRYDSADWIEQVQTLTRGGADVVMDGVGSTIPDSLSCLRPGGRLVAFGSSGGTTTKLDIRGLYVAQHTILGTTVGSPKDFAALLNLVDRARWSPVIDSVRPLDQLRAAHERMEAGEHFGKLVFVNPDGVS